MTAIEDQKRFADLFRKLDAEIHNVPGGHVGFIVQAERYLDLMERSKSDLCIAILFS